MENKRWVPLLEWRNMRADLLEYFGDMAKKYQKDTGRELHMQGGQEFSEIGYWELSK